LISKVIHLISPKWLKDLAGAWIFYSILPKLPIIKPEFNRIARFAPFIGLVIGSIQSIVWLLLKINGWPDVSLPFFILAIGYWLTGGLHLDGLIDTADGLAAGPEKCLTAMKDSRVGAIGLQALILILLLQLSALIKLAYWAPIVLPIVCFMGRISPIWAIGNFSYLHKREFSTFHKKNWAGFMKEIKPSLIFIFIFTSISLLVFKVHLPIRIIIGLLIGVIPVFIVPQILGIKLSGHSGDSYGASIVLSETFILIILAIILN
tara:strand:- start:240 stop:1028 length:789 start_codon:yes stop_codon:yes gene_type:complete